MNDLYRPLFVEGDEVKIEYTLSDEELLEAVVDFIEKKQCYGLEGNPKISKIRLDCTSYDADGVDIGITLVEHSGARGR